MTFLQQRLSTLNSKLLLLLGLALAPLLVYVMVSVYLQPSLPAAAPLALNMASVLMLAALGMAAAWALACRWVVLPSASINATDVRAELDGDASRGQAARSADMTAVVPGGLRMDAPELAYFHQMADAMPQLVSIMRADCSRRYVNQRWADYVGAPRSEILEHRWNRFLHPDDMPKVSAVWADAASRGESVEFEYRLRGADGCYRWMLGRAVPLVAAPVGGQSNDATSPALEWLMTSTDIDAMKKATVELEKSVAMKRFAGRVARLGGWSIELPAMALTWTDENCLIHDAPPGYQPTLEEGISYFLPEHRDQVRQHVQACASMGTPYDFVFPKRTLAGRLIWVRSIGEAVRDVSGQIVRIQGAFQDVTEQKQADARNQALELQLTATMEGITDGFYLLDADWNFTFLNATAARMFKQPREALLAQSVWSVFSDEGGCTTAKEFREAVKAQVTRQFEVFHPALATWFDVSCYPMGSGIAVYLQDISQRRAEQSQLRLLQTAVARLNDTVVIAQALSESIETGSTPVVFVNEAFERCTGFTREDILNQDFVTILRDHLGPDEWARVSLAMGQWQPVRAEIAMTSKAGAEIWLEVDIAPIADDGGRFTHWVAVKRDVTGRRRDQQEILSLSHSLNQELEGRVQLRTAQLARSNHMLESFAYAVSHDLRSPLNTIAGFIELLRKADGAHVSPKGQHCLDRIAAGTRQMGELIGGLLTLAQLSRESPHLQTVDLSTMAERLAQQCQRQQPDRLAALHIQPGLQAQADPRLLEVVLHNLLDNAWKFSARQATVRIEVGSTTEADGECAFFVKDNGVGFDMAFQHKLFGTFERLHSPGEFKGTGIGLVTAQRVVESHGGRMWAHSAVGQGATFYFTLSARTRATADVTTGSDVTVAVD